MAASKSNQAIKAGLIPASRYSSELLQAAVIAAAPDCIVTIDEERRILDWNPAAELTFGYPRDQVLGKSLPELIMPPELREQYVNRACNALSAEGASPEVRFEITAVRSSGGQFPVELAVVAITPEAQALPAQGTDCQTHRSCKIYACFLRDISSRKKIEMRLQFLSAANTLLASSLDYETTLKSVARLAVPDIADWCMIDLVEPDLSFRRLVVAHRDASREEVGLRLQGTYRTRAEDDDGLSRVANTGRAELATHVTDEMLAAFARDEEQAGLLREMGLASYMCVPLIARGNTLGTLTFAVADETRAYDGDDLQFAREVGRRAAFAVDNARLYSEVASANRVKDEFLATVSHEIRTPLTGILGWVHLLRGGRLDSDNSERALEIIERNALAQSQLIEDLLDVSRIITGKLRLNIRPLELGTVIAIAVDTIRPAAAAKSIIIETNLKAGAGCVTGDAGRLQQVVWNLLSNAVKFTPEGGRVVVSLEDDERHSIFTVSDTGEGIAGELLPYVFDRFRQGDGSITRTHGGIGLGLAVVRHLVELHGGTVQVESPGKGEGATFTVRFPLLRHDGSKCAAGGAKADDSTSPAVAAQPPAWLLNGVRVVIVGNSEDLAGSILEAFGADIRTVGTVDETTHCLQQWHPHVVVADFKDNSELATLLRRVRALSPRVGGGTPIIGLTSESAGAVNGLAAALSWPVDPAQLAIGVAHAAGRSLRQP